MDALGQRLAIGAFREGSHATGVDGDPLDDSAEHAGAVYVFDLVGNEWVQQAYIKASNTSTWDEFGRFLDLSGDGQVLAVGAIFEDGAAAGVNADDTLDGRYNSGAVYVFTPDLDAGTWVQRSYVKALNPDGFPPNMDMNGPDTENLSADGFGNRVALSNDGSVLAISAPEEDGLVVDPPELPQDDHANTYPGAVYVY